MLVLAVLLAACTIVRAKVFNVTYIDVPKVVAPDVTEVIIECRYDADFTLLSWFKGSREFFRYRPSEVPSTRSFPSLGIGKVEMLTCGLVACQLRLGALTEQATGLYRCDLERDVPPYQFATMTAYMKVQGHEHRKPLLQGVADEYREGDVIEAYCRGGPESELRWYINGRELEDFRGSSHLKKECRRYHFLGNPPSMVLQCADFRYGNIYGSIAKTVMWNDSPMRKNVRENKGLNGSSAIRGNLGLLSIFLCFLVKVFYV